MDKEFNDENMSEEERQKVAMMGILEFWRKQKANQSVDDIVNATNDAFKLVARVEKSIYDNYISVGFSDEQALLLAKSKMELIIKDMLNK